MICEKASPNYIYIPTFPLGEITLWIKAKVMLAMLILLLSSKIFSLNLAVLLQSTFTKQVKADLVSVRTVMTDNDDELAELQVTDLHIFKEATDSIDEYTDPVGSYFPTQVLPNQNP